MSASCRGVYKVDFRFSGASEERNQAQTPIDLFSHSSKRPLLKGPIQPCSQTPTSSLATGQIAHGRNCPWTFLPMALFSHIPNRPHDYKDNGSFRPLDSLPTALIAHGFNCPQLSLPIKPGLVVFCWVRCHLEYANISDK